MWSSEGNNLFRGVVGAVCVPFTSGLCCFCALGYAPLPSEWPWRGESLEAAGVACISSSIVLRGSREQVAEIKNWSSGPKDRRGEQSPERKAASPGEVGVRGQHQRRQVTLMSCLARRLRGRPPVLVSGTSGSEQRCPESQASLP